MQGFISVACGSFESSEYKFNHSEEDSEYMFVTLTGNIFSFGGSGPAYHIGPFWWCEYDSCVEYGMLENSILKINGKVQDVNYPATIYFYNFKGIAPWVFIVWLKMYIPGNYVRIRVFGICTEIEVENL